MPANLTPQYLEAELRFKEARSTEEKIEALEEMMAVIPKHKGTDKLRGMLRRRMARLQDDMQKQSRGKKAHDPYLIRKEGAGQIGLYGLPNSGKSSLMSSLTRASCEVADYPFTTRMPTPGMMTFENISIQLLDLPPLMDEASESWRPRVLKRVDSVAFIIDSSEDAVTQMEILEDGLREMGLPGMPDERNKVSSTAGSGFIRGFICLNKVDLIDKSDEILETLSRWNMPRLAVSTITSSGLESFRRAAFDSLGIIRVYTKAPHKKAKLTDPIILPRGAVLEDAARALHKDFVKGLKFAKIWGDGFYDGQLVGRDQVLHDGAVVELHT